MSWFQFFVGRLVATSSLREDGKKAVLSTLPEGIAAMQFVFFLADKRYRFLNRWITRSDVMMTISLMAVKP